MSDTKHGRRRGLLPSFAVILGTNEIASAAAVHLHRAGFGVVMSHDPMLPVIRRKMAFHDALFDDEPVALGGAVARRAETSLDVRTGLARGYSVLVTSLGLLDLIVIGAIDVLVDARMNKYQVTPDLRRLAGLTIGLGPGFCGGANCDVAIETHPAKAGAIVQQGPTDAPDGMPRELGSRRQDRFVRSDVAGRWHTAIEIGTRVYKDFLIGHLGDQPVRAPFDGFVRGVARDGTEVPAGVKLLEIDPRGRNPDWAGIDPLADVIAGAVLKAMSFRRTRALDPMAAVPKE